MRVGSPHTGVRRESVLGGEVYERHLLEALPRHGVEVVLGLPRSRAPEAVPPGWEVSLLRPSRGLRWYIAPAAFVPFTLWLLARNRVDLLRGHSVRFTGPSLFLARALARARVPIVLHHHHTDRGWETVEGALLRRSDGVITVSEHSRRQLERLGVEPDRISVSHPGVERPDGLPGVAAGDAWPPAAGLRLLYVGRLLERKRPALALDTLAELARARIPATLCIAGAGSLRSELESHARSLGIAEAIRWLGEVSEARKWALYQEADVLLFTSALEGFGFVVAEAQLSGLPVVVAGGTASSEIVVAGETGEIADATGAALASGVRRLADPVRRRAMSEAARRSAARFTWDASAARVAVAYQEVTARFRHTDG